MTKPDRAIRWFKVRLAQLFLLPNFRVLYVNGQKSVRLRYETAMTLAAVFGGTVQYDKD